MTNDTLKKSVSQFLSQKIGDGEHGRLDSDDEFEFGTTVVDAGATSLKVNVLGQSFTLSQQLEPKDLAPLFSDEWTGSQVWSCSVVLSTFIGQSVKKGDIVLKDKNVVELGAGCGLCGIYAHYLGGKIIATDQTDGPVDSSECRSKFDYKEFRSSRAGMGRS